MCITLDATRKWNGAWDFQSQHRIQLSKRRTWTAISWFCSIGLAAKQPDFRFPKLVRECSEGHNIFHRDVAVAGHSQLGVGVLPALFSLSDCISRKPRQRLYWSALAGSESS